jgi:hypothetical protein
MHLYSLLRVTHSAQLILLGFITQIMYTARKTNNAAPQHAVFYNCLHSPSIRPEYLAQYLVLQTNVMIRVI